MKAPQPARATFTNAWPPSQCKKKPSVEVEIPVFHFLHFEHHWEKYNFITSSPPSSCINRYFYTLVRFPCIFSSPGWTPAVLLASPFISSTPVPWSSPWSYTWCTQVSPYLPYTGDASMEPSIPHMALIESQKVEAGRHLWIYLVRTQLKQGHLLEWQPTVGCQDHVQLAFEDFQTPEWRRRINSLNLLTTVFLCFWHCFLQGCIRMHLVHQDSRDLFNRAALQIGGPHLILMSMVN